MNLFMLSALIAITTFDYLARIHLLPRFMKFTPELISAIVFLCIVFLGVRDRFRNVRAAYWLAFGAMAIVMVCGILSNGVETGPVIAGLRSYLRAIPLFLLPAVYAFREREVRRQLRFLGMICVLQLPVALDQRLSGLASGSTTGDMTTGTMLASGILSTFMICAICVLTAVYLRKRIGLKTYLLLFAIFLIPTTINETKVTVLFLPLGLMATFLVDSRPGARIKGFVVATSILLVAGAIFIPIYDYLISQKHGPTVSDFFFEKGNIERYVTKDAKVGAQTIKEVGRVDAVLIPIKEMSKTFPFAAFGLGIGNASQSSLGQQFNGEFFSEFGPFLKSSASSFILELGLLGMMLALLLPYLIFKDSCVVAARNSGIISTLALGWSGVTAVIILATFYTTIDGNVPISYTFWYLSGLVAAERMRGAPGRV